MTKDNSNTRTPIIRFPGFTGEWREKKLNEVFSRVTRKNAENNQNVLTISAQYGLISQLEFFKKSVASSDVTGYYLLHKGEFAYNKSSSQGRPVGAIKPLRLYDKGVVSTLYICFKCNNPEEIDFWEQYFDAGILDSEILSIAQEGARNHGLLNISTGDFFGLNVILPTPPEMKKIAECLSSFDDVITAAENELDSLKAHKKGLMQQLFPQPSATTPALRFPGFAGDWEVKKLGEIADVNPKSDKLPNKFVYIDLESVESGNLLKKNIIEVKNAPSRAQRLLKKGDILFQMVRPYQRNNYHFYDNDGNVYVASTGYAQIRYKDCSEYLYQYLHTDTFVDIAISKCVGGNYPAINTTDLTNITVYLPSPAEQQKIAECLETLDNLIAAESNKLESLKTHKKGLMQQLFPQPVK